MIGENLFYICNVLGLSHRKIYYSIPRASGFKDWNSKKVCLNSQVFQINYKPQTELFYLESKMFFFSLHYFTQRGDLFIRQGISLQTLPLSLILHQALSLPLPVLCEDWEASWTSILLRCCFSVAISFWAFFNSSFVFTWRFISVSSCLFVSNSWTCKKQMH